MRWSFFVLAALAGPMLAGCDAADTPAGGVAEQIDASWARDAVFYQIFPERFSNGDPANDPVREAIEAGAPESWQISPWTGDWYARAPWESEMGEGFYEAVFHRRYGGDLQGVVDRLPYLDELGITALYFNPIFYARSLHKYDASSFHHVDPYFGPDPRGDLAMMSKEDPLNPDTWIWTSADSLFLALIRQAHERGMRVVIDGVFNHTGLDFFAFQDIREKGPDSPYAGWYKVLSWDDPATPEDEFDHEGWWGYKPLPLFADNADETDLQEGVREYVFNITRRWMSPDGNVADGVDGWRLDVATDVPMPFWQAWNAFARSINPAVYTVAENWHAAAEFIAEGDFSATMNYHGFAFPVKGFLIDDTLSATGFDDMLRVRRDAFSPVQRFEVQNLVDSHDTDRLASMIVNAGRLEYIFPDWFDYDRGERVSPRANPAYLLRRPDARERRVQRLVALFQMTYMGAPMVYYGTEAGMWGADDPDDRMPMVWPELVYSDQAEDPLGRSRMPDTVAFDSTVFAFYREVIQLRGSHVALRRGTFETALADDDRSLYAYRRAHEEDALVILLNRSENEQTAHLPGIGPDALLFATAAGNIAVAGSDSLRLPPLSGFVFRDR